MRSCFTLLITLLILTAVVGSAGAIYYLSSTSDIQRVERTAPPSAPPR